MCLRRGTETGYFRPAFAQSPQTTGRRSECDKVELSFSTVKVILNVDDVLITEKTM